MVQVGDARLTARTQRLLMLETLPEVQAFIDTHRAFPLKRQTVVTCIATLNKSHPEVKEQRIKPTLWTEFLGRKCGMLGFGHRELLNLHSRPGGFHNHGQP